MNKTDSLKVFQFIQKSLVAGGRLQILPSMVKIDEVDDGATEVFHARFSIPLSKTREMCLLQHSRPNLRHEGRPLHLLATTSVFGHEVMKHHEVKEKGRAKENLKSSVSHQSQKGLPPQEISSSFGDWFSSQGTEAHTNTTGFLLPFRSFLFSCHLPRLHF